MPLVLEGYPKFSLLYEPPADDTVLLSNRALKDCTSYCLIQTAITVPTPVDFLFYLRFSADLGTTLSTEFVTSTIEIEVVSFPSEK